MADEPMPRCVAKGHFWSAPDADGVCECAWCGATILLTTVRKTIELEADHG